MDNMKILKRAWTILWNYRTLWIFGLILALTMGSATYNRFGSNSNYRYQQNYNNQTNFSWPWNNGTFSDPQQFSRAVETSIGELGTEITSAHASGALIGFGILFLVLLLAAGIVLTLLRYVSETAVVRMVNDYEDSGIKLTFRQGFRLGWNRRAWRLFLIDLLIGLVPVLTMFLILALAIFGLAAIIIKSPSSGSGIALLAVLVGLIFLIFLLILVYNILMSFLRRFIARACALEDSGVWKSINDGVGLGARNWKAAGKFWLIMIGLGIAWMIASAVLVILLIPFFLISVILGALVAGVPGLLFGSISAIFVGSFWPFVIGAAFALPVFILVVSSPLLLLEGMVLVFTSSAWTLVYRQVNKPVVQPEVIPAAG